MKIFFYTLFALTVINFAKAKDGCPGQEEWVPEIGDCAIVVYDEEDLQNETLDQWIAKLDQWFKRAKNQTTCLRKGFEYAEILPPGGKVISVSGTVKIERGLKILIATPGLELKPGDIVAVSKTASTELKLNRTGTLKVTSENRFQVPKSKEKNGLWPKINNWTGSLWSNTKKCLSSPPPPSLPTGGVRG